MTYKYSCSLKTKLAIRMTPFFIQTDRHTEASLQTAQTGRKSRFIGISGTSTTILAISLYKIEPQKVWQQALTGRATAGTLAGRA